MIAACGVRSRASDGSVSCCSDVADTREQLIEVVRASVRGGRCLSSVVKPFCRYSLSVVFALRRNCVPRGERTRKPTVSEVVNTNIKSVLPELPTRASGCFLLGLL